MLELSLFTGAGGGILGTHLLGWTPVGYVEFNDYCQRVLKARIQDGHIPEAPIFGDIRAFISDGYAARDTLRIVRPRYALLENVPGILAKSHGYFGTILRDLAEMGYHARWGVLGADDVGAPHLRKRIWVVAYAEKTARLRRDTSRADSKGACYRQDISGRWNNARALFGSDYMDYLLPRTAHGTSQSGFHLVVDGMANYLDQSGALGNGQIPGVARLAWETLSKPIG
jgi:DNA (cytosine-5)-methyltransferase 1